MSNTTHDGKGGGKHLSWLYAAIVFTVAFTLQRSVALLGLDLHHDTFMFDAASRLLHGGLPYKDFFYQYNLGTVFFHALALLLGGLRISALKIETAIAYAVIALFVYLIASLWGRRGMALAAGLFWASLSPFYMPNMNGYHPWSTVYMMASVMAGTYLLLLSLLKKRNLLLTVGAGMCFALAFWFKQVAVVQIVLTSMWLVMVLFANIRGSDRQMWILKFAAFLCGLLTGSLPFFSYMTTNHLFTDWFNCSFVFNGYFAASGGSAANLQSFMNTILPVSQDLGYRSHIWMLMPLSLLSILLMYRDRKGSGIIFRNCREEDQTGRAISLLTIVGFAGWIEYFPLAHSFHTQLFMAPVFSLLAICAGEVLDRRLWNTRYLLLNLTLSVIALDGAYEVANHLIGLKNKVSGTWVQVAGDNPVQGIRLSPDYSSVFLSFYKTMLAENLRYGGRVLPMSVDPLRALIPYSIDESKKYRMGVDWSWTNEIVEPGFNERLRRDIAERNSIVYADSPVVIPGYVIAALLEMPSPITLTHTLYVPSRDPVVARPEISAAHHMFLAPGDSIITTLEPRVFDKRVLRLVEINRGVLSIGELTQLHVSMVTLRDLPKQLIAFEYKEFFTNIPYDERPDFSRIYRLTEQGTYVMLEHPDAQELLRFARFLLDRGKIFPEQNRPVYNSTLMKSSSDRPVLLGEFRSSGPKQLLWMKGMSFDLRDKLIGSIQDNTIYIGIPNDHIDPKEPVVFFIQAIAESGKTWNSYVYYQPDSQ